jgi:pimeloyl-ACP methyl ester carboxylesterase
MKFHLLKSTFLILVLLLIGCGILFYERPVACFRAWQSLKLRLSGTESHTIQVNGMRIHYETLGPANGAPVLLIHGLGGNAEDWRNLAPYLTKAGYRVIMPDLPGYGRSEQPANFSYSIADEASTVVAFMDALNLHQVELGGWSMGGWIAQTVAANHPERISRLIIFNSAGLKFMPAWDTRLFTPQSAAELDQLDALLMPNPPQVPAFVARDILRHSHQNAWIIQRALASMLTGVDATDSKLPTLKMPVLIVWDDLDQITPVSEGHTMHNLIPTSELFLITGCGHMAPVTCSTKIGPKLAEFAAQ